MPWVNHDHWSLLVFQYGKVVHLDSAEKPYHQPEGRDAAFVNAVSHAWQCLRGVEPYVVPVVRLEVLRQVGNYECGHHTIRNSIIYLKVRDSGLCPTVRSLTFINFQILNLIQRLELVLMTVDASLSGASMAFR